MGRGQSNVTFQEVNYISGTTKDDTRAVNNSSVKTNTENEKMETRETVVKQDTLTSRLKLKSKN